MSHKTGAIFLKNKKEKLALEKLQIIKRQKAMLK